MLSQTNTDQREQFGGFIGGLGNERPVLTDAQCRTALAGPRALKLTDAHCLYLPADTVYGFAKTFVRDLDAMGRFYQGVFGLIENNRHTDVMFSRGISEISYRGNGPGGTGGLTLITYLNGDARGSGEAVQGFITQDLEAVCNRALAAGGTVPDPIRHIPEFGIKVAFVLDPEGHVNEVVQMVG